MRREDVSAPDGFVREVGSTVAEFERGLRLAVPKGVSPAGDGLLTVAQGGVALEIALTVLPERRLGLFRLPMLSAHYRFVAGSEAERAALLAHLDRSMQRGGG